VGDATKPEGDGSKVIVHVCNDIGAWGAGFVLALSKRWREPEASYKAWSKDQAASIPFELGQVQIVRVALDIEVANLIGQRGIRRAGGLPPVRYEAIEHGLEIVAKHCLEHSASVHMPRIGCGLAGGKWPEIERLIDEQLIAKGVIVTVYDLG
jgi:O-acetyl-ADP-ribose deacetylase (regulator of RNase III)